MSNFYESKINNSFNFIKIKSINNQIIFPKENIKDSLSSGSIKRSFIKSKFNDYNSVIDNNFKYSSYILNNDLSNSFSLKHFNNSKILNETNCQQNTPNTKYINLKDLFSCSRKSISQNYLSENSISMNQTKQAKINNFINPKNILLKKKKIGKIRDKFSFVNILRYNDYRKFEKLNKEKAFKKNIYNSEESYKLDISENTKNDFLQQKCGLYLYKDKYINEYSSLLKRYDLKKFINEMKKKKSKKDVFSYFNKLKSKLLEENNLMRKKVKSSYSTLEIKKKNIFNNLNIDTPKEFRKLFFSFNKKRAEKEKIKTNLYINESKNPKSSKLTNFKNNTNRNIINEKNIANLAIREIDKQFHDLLVFNLPELDDKIYIRKILYDVFIEFKNMLVLSMMRNKNINIDEKSIDFESFYNCNTKINQQGHILAKKLFKVFNNKTNNKVLSFENYINGMIKLKNSSKENKINFFFEMLDEKSKGYMSYDDIYKFGIICLQKITLNIENYEDFIKAKNEKNNRNIQIVENLVDYFTRMIFKLVNIDIKKNIPLKLLKKMIIQGGEQADYIEFLFGSGKF